MNKTQAFTLGRETSYDRAITEAKARGGQMKKTGLRDDYSGGWVWVGISDVKAFKQLHPKETSTYAIYELSLPTSWEVDVGAKGADGVHRLINDAPIVRKINVA